MVETGPPPVLRRWSSIGSIPYADPRTNHCLDAGYLPVATNTIGTTNANNIVTGLPLVHANAAMRGAGEIRHAFAPGMPGEPPSSRTLPNNPLWLSSGRLGHKARISAASVW